MLSKQTQTQRIIQGVANSGRHALDITAAHFQISTMATLMELLYSPPESQYCLFCIASYMLELWITPKKWSALAGMPIDILSKYSISSTS